MAAALQDDLINLLPAAAPGLTALISEHLRAKTALGTPSGIISAGHLHGNGGGRESVAKPLRRGPRSLALGRSASSGFAHRLHKEATWADMSVGPDEIGSPTTLGMAMHMGKGPGQADTGEIPAACTMVQPTVWW